MKFVSYVFLILILVFFKAERVLANEFVANENMLSLLRNSGVGILIGAGLGTVVMATQDEPGQHSQDVAKGASLGLYAGLAYSYYAFTRGSVHQLGVAEVAPSSSAIQPYFVLLNNESFFGLIKNF